MYDGKEILRFLQKVNVRTIIGMDLFCIYAFVCILNLVCKAKVANYFLFYVIVSCSQFKSVFY